MNQILGRVADQNYTALIDSTPVRKVIFNPLENFTDLTTMVISGGRSRLALI